MSDTSKTSQYDPLEDYASFVQDELADGVSYLDIPAYDKFLEMRKQLSSKDGILNFVSPGKIGGLAGAAYQNPAVKRLVDAGVNAVSQEGQRIAENIAQRLESGEAFVKVKQAFGDTGGNSGTGAGGSGSPNDPFNPNRMNFNPKPVQVRLDTGIRSKGYGDYYPESRIGLNVLEISQVWFLVPNAAVSELKSYFDNVITFNFQNDAQMRVNFNVDAITKFSSANLSDWMNRYAEAYGKYVFYTTVINYCNEPLQQNAGMRALRSMMTPQLLDDLSQLANMLDGTPAPPKFRELIHFIYGAPFKVSSNPGSQIRLISPSVLKESTVDSGLDSLPANDIRSAIDGLYSTRQTTALIARVCPNWIPGRGNTPAGATVPEYSPNWHTLWENLPYHNTIGGVARYGPPILDENRDAIYGSTADILDGAITSLWNGWDMSLTGVSDWDRFRPGTMGPRVSGQTVSGVKQYDNRISFKYNPANGSQRFICTSTGLNEDQYMRQETYTVATNGTTHTIIWPGREIINNINIASARQTAYEVYSKMFDMGSTTNKSFDRGGKRSIRRRRGKSKSDSDTMNEEI